MTEPLHLSFDVACTPEHAFATWTQRLDTWWPADHTVSGDAAARVILEGHPGGRIFERAPDGREHDWGRVLRWAPPTDLVYSWHLGGAPETATHVAIRFVGLGDTRTRVEIEHTGWEGLGADAPLWRNRNQAGWDSLLPRFRTAIEKEHR
jgi:uncharacterized protein YndB with AHSA1/START domain